MPPINVRLLVPRSRLAGDHVLVFDENDPTQGAIGAVPVAEFDTPAGARYEHVQSSPSASWSVSHNLGFKPNVIVYSPGGLQVGASVLHISVNQTVINFNTPQSGSAVFN